ncbi:MAG: rRNA pseudouridine synthase [Marinilabiliales bacterium]|nr:MAG: rRNA pseudouridine synthase [Marinilabiliales bacterium]
MAEKRDQGRSRKTGRPRKTGKSGTTGRPGRPGDTDRKEEHPFEKFKKKRQAPAKGIAGRAVPKKAADAEGRSGMRTAGKHSEIRLNRFIANSGICSRREADEYIKAGHIIVNNKVVKEVGTKVLRSDVVRFKGKKLDPENKVYLLLNKPKDFITTVDDPRARRTVMDLVRNACRERIYPVGRLDRHTTGLLLFTNDGDLTKKLTHPSHGAVKIYQAGLDRPLEPADLEEIAKGVELDDGHIKVDEISWADETDRSRVGIRLHSGKNRIIRRIFGHFDYNVTQLDRVFFAGLTKKNLPRGKWRFLNEKEVNKLKMNIFK